jgi:hypothetical protein
MHKKTVTRIFINDSMPDAHLGHKACRIKTFLYLSKKGLTA